MIYFLALAIAMAFALLGGFLYFDLSRRVAEIEQADDAPHNIIRQVEESHIMNRDNKDAVRRLEERVDSLESRKLTISKAGRAS